MSGALDYAPAPTGGWDTFRRRFGRVLDWLCAIWLAVACVLLATLVIVVFASIVFGALRQTPPLWLAEYTRASFGGFVLLSIGPGLRSRSHLAVEIFARLLPERAQVAMQRAVALLVATFCVLLLWAGVTLVDDNRVLTLPSGVWPGSIYYLAIAPGAAVAALVAVELALFGSSSDQDLDPRPRPGQ